MPARQRGVLVSQSGGEAIAYALFNLQARGEIFISPGEDLYEGMVLGVNNKGVDLVVNALKGKKLTIVRYKAKSNRDRRIGHRQHYAEIKIDSI